MKAVLFNGSPRQNGNTNDMLKTLSGNFLKNGIETEIVQIGCDYIRGCRACYKCKINKDHKCIYDEDNLNLYYQKMLHADIIIIGSPTYFADLTSETKALIDRCGLICRANNHSFFRKIGAAVVPVRRAGSIHVFDSINHFFLINNMIIPGSDYWNMSLAAKENDYKSDEEGLKTMNQLAENIIWLSKKLYK